MNIPQIKFTRFQYRRTFDSCPYQDVSIPTLGDILEANERLTLAQNNIILRRYEDQYLEKLKELCLHTSLLSQQAVNDFNIWRIQSHGKHLNFDVIGLLETWLRNDSNILNYVKIAGYSF